MNEVMNAGAVVQHSCESVILYLYSTSGGLRLGLGLVITSSAQSLQEIWTASHAGLVDGRQQVFFSLQLVIRL